MLRNLIDNIKYGMFNSTVEQEIDKLIDQYCFTNIDYKMRQELFGMKRLVRPGWRPTNQQMDTLRDLWELDQNDLWCNEFCGVDWEDWIAYVSNQENKAEPEPTC